MKPAQLGTLNSDLPPLEEFALGADEVDEIRARLHANAERRAQ